jgi:hypothetical protein
MGNQHLADRFADAGLRLALAGEPIARAVNAERVFQMDIRRARAWDSNSEHFVVWYGAVENVGRDERQLFMCRLPSACTTLAQAHATLRAPEATAARGVLARTIRQGEWFFVPTESAVQEEIDRDVRRGKLLVHRNASIGAFIPRAGKPHRTVRNRERRSAATGWTKSRVLTATPR